MAKNFTQEDFLQRMKENFGDKFDFSESVYNGYEENITYKCPKHGYITTKARNLIKGYGCKACLMEVVKAALRKTQEQFLEEVIAVHGDRYDYSLVEYVNSATKVKIICPEHGVFKQTPNSHLQEKKCPRCALNESKSLVCGIDINDYNGAVKINREHIDSYKYWSYVLKRCYSLQSLQRNRAYIDCSISDDWIYFTNFKEWFDNPENGFMLGYELDKDLLVHGNRIYPDTTCCFLSPEINRAINKQKSKRGKYKIGVFYRKDMNKFVAQIQSGIHEHRQIGIYETEQEAFLAYKAEKERYLRYLGDKYFSQNLITKKVFDALYNYEVMEDD